MFAVEVLPNLQVKVILGAGVWALAKSSELFAVEVLPNLQAKVIFGAGVWVLAK